MAQIRRKQVVHSLACANPQSFKEDAIMIETELFSDLINDYEAGKVTKDFVVQVATWRVRRISEKEIWNVYPTSEIDVFRNGLPCTARIRSSQELPGRNGMS
jgi:hypothetical protein